MNATPRVFYLRARRKLAHLAGDRRAVSRWSNLLASEAITAALRSQFDSAIPPAINLEINTDCNYRCPFCPQSTYRRPPRYITRQGFQHVVHELRALDFSGQFVLSVNNEPFLHPLLLEFCAVISSELPRATTCIISNGALVREEHLVRLAQLLRPPAITIDDYTPDHAVAKRMRGWLARPECEALSVSVVERSWREQISNRAGNQPGCRTIVGDYHDIVCAWPFGGLFLNPELKVFLCCSDYRYEAIVGDLNTQRLMDIWAGPALQEIRSALLVPDRSAVPLCARCDAECWCLPEHCKKKH